MPISAAARSTSLARVTRASAPGEVSVSDQDQTGSRVHPGEVAVQEGLEVAHRRGQMGSLLDLEDELPGRRPVGAAARSTISGRRARAGRERPRSRRRVWLEPGREQPLRRLRVGDRPAGQVAGDRGSAARIGER